MKEIKFRGLMTTGEWVCGLPSLDLPGETCCYDKCSYRIVWHPLSGGVSNAPIENGTLTQYTGITDKNGKEIYEGDICQAMKGEQTKPKTFYKVQNIVTFRRGSFEFFSKPLSDVNIDKNGNAENILWCWHGDNNLPDIYEEINSIEVIGNIYENPELLEQK